MIDKIEEGKSYILLDSMGYDFKIYIDKAHDEDYPGIALYLFGAEGMLGEKHTFKTPKELLLLIIDSCGNDRIIAMCSEKSFPNITYYNTDKKYHAVIDGTQYTGEKRVDLAFQIFPKMKNADLINCINGCTDYSVIPVYCVDSDPTDLVTDEEYNTAQIGYAVVDNEELESETLYDSPQTAVEDYLCALRQQEPLFRYLLYIKIGEEWELLEESEEFEGDDFMTNGMLDALGEDWVNAEEVDEV